jgi:hypothetical protein
MIPSWRAASGSLRGAVLALSIVLFQAAPASALVIEHQGGGSGSPPPPTSVPEIDLNVALAGLTLAMGGLLVLTDRRR